MPDQCYFNGDFYQCAADTLAGESPVSAPSKWRKVQMPQGWRWPLLQLTYAHLLELDGQTDKAAVTRRKALGADADSNTLDTQSLSALVHREAQQELKAIGGRPNVQTPPLPLNWFQGLRERRER